MSELITPIITIDGPSGVGKGTLAQYISCKTNYHFLDSGAIYRSLAFASVTEGIDAKDVAGLVALARDLDVKFVSTTILYKDKDITKQIRTEQTAAVASIIAAIPEVRAALLQRQKDFAKQPGLVADGRDMGTVVFPDAPVKLFLMASASVRAERRVKQLKNQGVSANIQQITKDIEERDERDRTRSASPLVPAADAIEIDTSDLPIDEVCNIAMRAIEKAGLLS